MTPEEVAARVALRALVDEYALRTDRFDYDGYTELFTPDGEIAGTAPGADEPFFAARGSAELAQTVHENDVFEQTFHAVNNHICTVDGDRATGITYCTARHLLKAEDGTLSVILTPIRYHDDYALTDAGWRFASRRIEFTWVERATVDPDAIKAWTGD